MSTRDEPPQVAVWYFVAATFIFSAPVWLLRDGGVWMPVACVAVGFVVMVLGGIEFGKELRARAERRGPDAPPPHPPGR